MPTKQFLITAVLVTVSAGAIVVMGKGPVQKQDKQQAAQLRFDNPEAVTEVKVAPNVELIHEAPTNVAPVEPPVEVAAPVEAVDTSPTGQVETYKFAAELTAAGIAEPDHGYATEMLVDDQGWRV